MSKNNIDCEAGNLNGSVEASGSKKQKDGFGSRKEKERFWLGVVSRWCESGLGVRAFCRDEGLKEPSFYFWRRELDVRGLLVGEVIDKSSKLTKISKLKKNTKLKKRKVGGSKIQAGNKTDVSKKEVLPAFVPVMVNDHDANMKVSGKIEVRLRCGTVLCVGDNFDPCLFERVLTVLEGRAGLENLPC